MPAVTTNGSGRATFVLGPYTPVATTKISFSVRFLGSLSPGHTYFVGNGGATPNFFYFMPDNTRSFRQIVDRDRLQRFDPPVDATWRICHCSPSKT